VERRERGTAVGSRDTNSEMGVASSATDFTHAMLVLVVIAFSNTEVLA